MIRINKAKVFFSEKLILKYRNVDELMSLFGIYNGEVIDTAVLWRLDPGSIMQHLVGV